MSGGQQDRMPSGPPGGMWPPPGPVPWPAPPLPWPPPPPRVGAGVRVAAAVVLGLAGLIVLVATFVPEARYTSMSRYSGTRTTTYGEWSTTTTPSDGFDAGFPVAAFQLTVAVLVALLAAVVLLAGRGVARSVARTLGAVAAGAMAGITSVIVVQLLTTLTYQTRNAGDPATGFSSTYVLLPGSWLMLAGCVMALAAVTLLLCVRDQIPRTV